MEVMGGKLSDKKESNVKVLPTELYRGKGPIDYPAQGNPYNALPPL